MYCLSTKLKYIGRKQIFPKLVGRERTLESNIRRTNNTVQGTIDKAINAPRIQCLGHPERRNVKKLTFKKKLEDLKNMKRDHRNFTMRNKTITGTKN